MFTTFFYCGSLWSSFETLIKPGNYEILRACLALSVLTILCTICSALASYYTWCFLVHSTWRGGTGKMADHFGFVFLSKNSCPHTRWPQKRHIHVSPVFALFYYFTLPTLTVTVISAVIDCNTTSALTVYWYLVISCLFLPRVYVVYCRRVFTFTYCSYTYLCIYLLVQFSSLVFDCQCTLPFKPVLLRRQFPALTC